MGRSPLSVLVLFLAICIASSAIDAFLLTGVSKDLSRPQSYAETSSHPIGIFSGKKENSISVVMPDGLPWIYVFGPPRTSTFSRQISLPDQQYYRAPGATCIGPSQRSLYSIIGTVSPQIVRNSTVGLYHIDFDGSVSTFFTSNVNGNLSLGDSTFIFCTDEYLLLVYDWKVLKTDYNFSNSSVIALSQTFSATSVDQKRLLALHVDLLNWQAANFTLIDTSGSNLNAVQTSNVFLSNMEPVQWSCLFPLADNRTFAAVLLRAQGHCAVSLLLIDSFDIANTSVRPIPTTIPHCENANELVQCATFSDSNFVNILFASCLSEVSCSHSVLQLDTHDLSSVLLSWPQLHHSNAQTIGFPEPDLVQFFACDYEIDVNLCSLYTYEMSSNGSFVSELPLASSPYNIIASISSANADAQIAYMISASTDEVTSAFHYGQMYRLEVLKVNVTSDSSLPIVATSFVLSTCEALVNSPQEIALISFFGLQNDSLILWTDCHILVFDANTLELLSRTVVDDTSCSLLSSCYPYCALISYSDGVLVAAGATGVGAEYTLVIQLQSISVRTGRCASPINITAGDNSYIYDTFPSVSLAFVNASAPSLYIVSDGLFAELDAYTFEIRYVYWNVNESDAGLQLYGSYWLWSNANGTLLYSLAASESVAMLSPQLSFRVYNLTTRMIQLEAQWQNDVTDLLGASFSLQTRDDLYVLFDSGFLAKVNLSSALPADALYLKKTSEGSFGVTPTTFTGIHLSNDGALYIPSSDLLYLVYIDCPNGYFRNIESGQCQLCPNNSLSSSVSQQICEPCPIYTTANVSENRCVCSPGYFSANNSIACGVCPVGANCSGDNGISPQNGFWQGDNATFYECPLASACTSRGCAEGYAGPLCSLCARGYGRTPTGCSACHKHQWHYSLPIVAAALITLCLILMLLWRETKKNDERFFAVAKTVLTFIQVLSFPTGRATFFAHQILQQYYVRFTSILGTFGLRVFSLASLDCLFGKRVPSFYSEIFIFGFAPIAISALLLVLILLLRSPVSNRRSRQLSSPTDGQLLVKQSPHYSDSRIGAPVRLMMFLFLLLYPYVTTLLVQFFQCDQIDGRSYLLADFSYFCYDPKWRRMLLVIGTLTLLWPLCGPLAMFLLLRYGRQSVNLRFLMAAYRPQYYYWDIVELLREAVLLAAVVWDNYEQQRRPGWFSGLPLVASVSGLVLYAFVQPHKERSHTLLHAASLIGICFIHALPAVSAAGSPYHLAASVFVLAYLTLFAVVSVLYAIWVARKQIVGLVRTILCCCTARRVENEVLSRRERKESDDPLLLHTE